MNILSETKMICLQIGAKPLAGLLRDNRTQCCLWIFVSSTVSSLVSHQNHESESGKFLPHSFGITHPIIAGIIAGILID